MGLADDQLAEGIPVDLELWGYEGSYTPQGGAAKTIKAIPVAPGMATQDDFDGSPDVTHRVLRLKISARSDSEGQVVVKPMGRDVPGSGDTWLRGGITWYVRELEQDGVLDGTMQHVIRLTDTQGPEME